MNVERDPWARRERESARAYAAFRRFRDLGPTRQLRMLDDVPSRTLAHWSSTFDWHARAVAWDDAQAMIEDSERLEAIRQMHRSHQVAGRAALTIALAALRQLDVETMTAADVARLLDLGVRVERDTLRTSVAELQGVSTSSVDDPWERIARELSGT